MPKHSEHPTLARPGTASNPEPLLAAIQARLQQWAERAHANGWIDADGYRNLSDTVKARPADLFDSAERPLVVGLFGGTGVGKSSLLNRLAGDDVARTGVERPTSREITVYVHASVTVSRLPEEFPLTRLRTAIHRNARFHSVMWVDMPDVDSVEAYHRDLVHAWLPYLDVVLYVVSPERYRDDIGWRMLLEEGERHAWLFAISHWDRADPLQYDDFRQLLAQAGLPDAPVYRLDNTAQQPDDFDTLATEVEALSEVQTLQALEQAGIGQRLRELHARTHQVRESLPEDPIDDSAAAQHPADRSATGTTLTQAWHRHWSQEAPALQARLNQRAEALARITPMARQPSTTSKRWWGGAGRLWFLPVAGQPLAQSGRLAQDLPGTLIDAGLAARLQDSSERFVQDAAARGWPVSVLRRHQPDSERTEAAWAEAVNMAWEASTAKPGSTLQRGLMRGLAWLTTLLPLAALGWAGWYIVSGYWHSGLSGGRASTVISHGAGPGAQGQASGTSADAVAAGAWLGTDFAVHTLLLIALAWAVPRFLHHLARPGEEQIVRDALHRGAQAALVTHERLMDEACRRASAELSSMLADLDAVFGSRPVGSFVGARDRHGAADPSSSTSARRDAKPGQAADASMPPMVRRLLRQPAQSDV